MPIQSVPNEILEAFLKVEACKIFIENNGKFDKTPEGILFRTYPHLITDSKALDFLNHDLFAGEGYSAENGVKIIIYRAL